MPGSVFFQDTLRGGTVVYSQGQNGRLTDVASTEALNESVQCQCQASAEDCLACKPGSTLFWDVQEDAPLCRLRGRLGS